jgi:hypothetical protein
MNVLGQWLLSTSPWIWVPVCGLAVLLWACFGVGMVEFVAWFVKGRR